MAKNGKGKTSDFSGKYNLKIAIWKDSVPRVDRFRVKRANDETSAIHRMKKVIQKMADKNKLAVSGSLHFGERYIAASSASPASPK